MRMESIYQEDLPPNKLETKCTKMTDEIDTIKNGINGVSAGATNIHVSRGNAINSGTAILVGDGTGIHSGSIKNLQVQCDGRPINNNNFNPDGSGSQNIGGRLQFFKDGKFIFELVRSKEGEKAGWVSIPRKTFWPPSVSCNTTNTNYSKNESSTSLSFSDDNSSIQSSPWQRDHCWKQTSPRKDISLEMCMLYKRTKNFALSLDGYKFAQKKKRRPFDNAICQNPFIVVNGIIKSEDIPIKEENLNSIIDGQQSSNIIIKKENNFKTRAKLNTIIQRLIDKLPSGVFYLYKPSNLSGTVNHFSPTSTRITDVHNHQQHVSPRKRILRELEKVSLEDSTKRSRAKSFNNNNNNTSSLLNVQSSPNGQQQMNTTNSNDNTHAQTNGNSNDSRLISLATSARLYSSYSINSLLGNNNSEKNDSNLKDDKTNLRIMLANSGNNNVDEQKLSNSAFSSGIKKSPTWSISQDHRTYNTSPSNESQTGYGDIRSPESYHGQDSNLHSGRYKTVNNTIVSNSVLSGFHPYLSATKCSSSSISIEQDNIYNSKLNYSSMSPTQNLLKTSSNNRSPSSSSSSSIPIFSQPNKISTTTTTTTSTLNCNNNNTTRECSPIGGGCGGVGGGGTISPSKQEENSRISTKKSTTTATAFRQRYSSPQSAIQNDSTFNYKKSINPKRNNNSDDKQILTDNKLYHSAINLEHANEILRSSSGIPISALYYLYPPHNTASSYIPPVSYYHHHHHPISPYTAAAVAALRNPLWMHYDPNVMPGQPGPSSRLTSAVYPYNGMNPNINSQSLGMSSMHLSNRPINPWTPMNEDNPLTEDPTTLVNIKSEPSSDVPLNLSKH